MAGLYERIKELCDKKGIGVTRLATELGWAKNYFTKVSRGQDITTERLQMIADYFNVTTDYLIRGDSVKWYINEETAKLAQELLENDDRRILMDASRDLTPEELRAVVAMVDAFGKSKDSK